MALNVNFGNLLAQPKSAVEYQQMYAGVDDAREARQVNALAMQERRAQLADAGLKRQDEAGYRTLISQHAALPQDQLIQQLDQSGNPIARTEAQALRKAQLEAQVKQTEINRNKATEAHSTAQTDQLKAEQKQKVLSRAMDDVMSAQSPQQAMQVMQQYSTVLDPAALQSMTRELMGVQSQEQMDAWKYRRVAAIHGLKTAEEMKRQQRESASTLANRELVIDPVTGQPRVNQPYVDAKASVARAGVQPTLMAPIPVQLDDGTQALYQPGNKPGQQGQLIKIGGKNAAPSAKPAAATEGERNASGYYGRMVEATKLLDQFESTGKATYGTQAAGALPLVGAAAQGVAMTPEQQQYKQAQEDWVRAKLRKESGASIATDEMQKEIQTYFPQPWDGPEVRKQKRNAREVANRGMRNSAGVEAALVDQQTGRIDPGAPSASRIGGAQPAFGLDPSAIDAELARRKGK